MSGKDKFWELFLSEKIFGMFVLGSIAWGALAVIEKPETIVAGAIGAIAGFVTSSAASMMREKRRLTREEKEANVVNLEKVREEKANGQTLDEIRMAENLANGIDALPGFPGPGLRHDREAGGSPAKSPDGPEG